MIIIIEVGLALLAHFYVGLGCPVGWGQEYQGADKGRVMVVSSVSRGGGSRGRLGEPGS